jgi:hypothetical protein
VQGQQPQAFLANFFFTPRVFKKQVVSRAWVYFGFFVTENFADSTDAALADLT